MKLRVLKKITAAVLAGAAAVCMTACDGSGYTREGGEITTADVAELETMVESAEVSQAKKEEMINAESRDVMDREGNVITAYNNIETIVSTAPSITEILAGMGMADKIIAADIYSADVEGISPDICTLDFANLNIEELVSLAPDLVIVSGMSMNGADDPYAALRDAGVNVIYIPTSSSIAGIRMDIEFLGVYLFAEEQARELIKSIDDAGRDISEKAKGITDKKKVYFEIGAAPDLYSCGSGTFINEIINFIGAENIYANEQGWIANSEESVIAANPDVILTSVAYDGYDFNEIKSRAGWENISAVKNGAVYSVDANATSRPSQHIVEGMYAVAEAVYPEIYGEADAE